MSTPPDNCANTAAAFLPPLYRWLGLDEGDEPLPYRDTDGIWTVGKGHNLEAITVPLRILQIVDPTATHADCCYPRSVAFIQSRGGLTTDQVQQLLAYDVSEMLRWLVPMFGGAAVPWASWVAQRQAAVGNMAYNLGPVRFAAFDTFIHLMANGEWDNAGNDLADTLVAAQLPYRYGRIIQTIRTAEWPSALLLPAAPAAPT